MTFASAIRFAAPLLLAATLAGCVVPYDHDPSYGGNNYSEPYYGGSYYGGSHYYGGSSHYGGPHHRGNVYAADPSRSHSTHRTHRRDRHDGDGDFRRRHRTPERSGRGERPRRDHAESPRERRRAAADRTGSRTGDRSTDRRRRERAAERAAERPAVERRTRRAERQTRKRDRVPRRYNDYRGSDETGEAFSERVERARREAGRESMTIERILADGPVPEK